MTSGFGLQGVSANMADGNRDLTFYFTEPFFQIFSTICFCFDPHLRTCKHFYPASHSTCKFLCCFASVKSKHGATAMKEEKINCVFQNDAQYAGNK